MTFSKGEPGMAEEIMAACAERNAAEPVRRYLGMSRAGLPCERRIWFEFVRAPCNGTNGRTARIFDNGHAVEARVIRDLRLRYRVTDEQKEVSDFHGMFRGHIDGVIWAGEDGGPMLLEIKSANDDGFKGFRRHGIGIRPQYRGQVLLYMHYLGLKEALFVVENKNNQNLHFERVPADPEAAEGLKARALSIMRAPGPPPAESGDCYFCEWKSGLCWRMNGMEPLCMRCSMFVPRYWLRERGHCGDCDMCLLTLNTADRFGTCGGFSPR
ncbi:MAG: hypothetical protein LBQ79_02400 [Deltaproteobacteria bacterium]|jgi:hypothetical protein|nr:hypothetical protein [Deltaproteobacteria bacterium]